MMKRNWRVCSDTKSNMRCSDTGLDVSCVSWARAQRCRSYSGARIFASWRKSRLRRAVFLNAGVTEHGHQNTDNNGDGDRVHSDSTVLAF